MQGRTPWTTKQETPVLIRGDLFNMTERHVLVVPTVVTASLVHIMKIVDNRAPAALRTWASDLPRVSRSSDRADVWASGVRPSTGSTRRPKAPARVRLVGARWRRDADQDLQRLVRRIARKNLTSGPS